MDVDTWWPRLTRETQRWLIDHNGEPVPDDVADAIAAAGGSGRGQLPDHVVDRIEELANGET